MIKRLLSQLLLLRLYTNFYAEPSFVPEADIVLFLYRDSYYNEDLKKRNIVECIVVKNLHGETGTVELRWIAEDARCLALDDMLR